MGWESRSLRLASCSTCGVRFSTVAVTRSVMRQLGLGHRLAGSADTLPDLASSSRML